MGDVVLVLHADHRYHLQGELQVIHAHLRQPHLGYLALPAEVGENPELLGGGNLGVHPVQLEQIDSVHPEPAKAPLALTAQIVGTAAGGPLAGPERVSPALVAIRTASG